MKLGRCELVNFGSYKELSFDFSDPGLFLIHGPTGSGKSTILDAACWVLFGVTAKGGSVEDVKRWAGDGPTVGTMSVSGLRIVRTRGTPKQNDLYFIDREGKTVRGRDATETQKLLNHALACDASLFLSSAYFSEFSPVASFFTANAKTRREILERTADLEFAETIAESASGYRKVAKSDLDSASTAFERATSRLGQLEASIKDSKARSRRFEEDRAETIKKLKQKAECFVQDRKRRLEEAVALSDKADKEREDQIKVLERECRDAESHAGSLRRYDNIDAQINDLRNERCETCGAPKANDLVYEMEAGRLKLKEVEKTLVRLKASLQSLQRAVNPYTRQIDAILAETNVYDGQLAAAVASTNPFLAQIANYSSQLDEVKILVETFAESKENLNKRIGGLNTLYKMASDLRGAMLEQAVKNIEAETNRILSTHFDADLTVSLKLEGDALDAEISKSGNLCSYPQLSKGQRSMLRMAFIFSIMQATSNKSGVHFDTLFLDEPTDGMDNSLKVKAFSLFEELSKAHNSVYVIDHSEELKQLFDRQVRVYMEEDTSYVEVA